MPKVPASAAEIEAEIRGAKSAGELATIGKRLCAEVVAGRVGTRIGDTAANLLRLTTRDLEIQERQQAKTALVDSCEVLTPEEWAAVVASRRRGKPS